MITFELFSIKYMSTNLNWKEKTITINHNIEYIMTTLEYYKIENNTENKIEYNIGQDQDQELQFPFTYSDIHKYWLKNINIYSKLYSKLFNIDIDFNILKLDIDYTIAPIYISKSKLVDSNIKDNIILIIGIFLIDNKNINYRSDKYNFISTIKCLPSSKKCDKNKYNIISGILNYQYEKQYEKGKGKENKNLQNDFKEKYLLINNLKIPLYNILHNACNYLPKLDIIINSNKILQGCFKIS